MSERIPARPAVGRELDAAVALALGLPRYGLITDYGGTIKLEYSTSLSAAGLILERWRERGYRVAIVGDGAGWEIELWPPRLKGDEPIPSIVGPTCDTLPEAISRCVLLVAEATR